MRKSPFIWLLLLAALISAAVAAAAPESDATRRKARYYYLEGSRRMAARENDAAFELFKKAYSIDPSYVEAANAYGSMRLTVATDSLRTTAQRVKSFGLLRPFVELYPAEYPEISFYAYAAMGVDSMPAAISALERYADLQPKNSVALLQLADIYARASRANEAVAAYDRFEQIEGKSAQIGLRKMSAMLMSLDTLGAINVGHAMLAENPRDPTTLVLMGNLYEVVGNNDSTLHYYLKAEEIEPNNGSVKISLANYYEKSGDSIAFDNKIYEALLSEDFDLEDKLSISQEYLQNLLDGKGDTKRGDHLFETLTSQYPHEPALLDLAARYSGAKGEFDDAVEKIGYAIDLDPTNVAYWMQLVRYQLAEEKPAAAMESYRRAATHIEIPEGMKLLYAAAAAEEKKYDEAIDTYLGLIRQTNPKLTATDRADDKAFRASLGYDQLIRLSSIYGLIGDTFYADKRLDDTYAAYDNALFFYPGNSMALNNYAYFLCENGGDLDKALEMSEKAIEILPDNETFIDTFAWILFRKKDYERALEEETRALQIAEEKGEVSPEFYHHLGDILFMNHQPEEALDNWKKALELEPDNKLLKKKVEHKTFFFE